MDTSAPSKLLAKDAYHTTFSDAQLLQLSQSKLGLNLKAWTSSKFHPNSISTAVSSLLCVTSVLSVFLHLISSYHALNPTTDFTVLDHILISLLGRLKIGPKTFYKCFHTSKTSTKAISIINSYGSK